MAKKKSNNTNTKSTPNNTIPIKEHKNKSEKSNKSRSEIIEDFLTLLRESGSKYDFNHENMNRMDLLATDIDHKFEKMDLTYHQYAQLGKKLTECQRERRIYKDEVEELRHIVEWYKNNQSVYNSLSQLLGNIRKEERYHKERVYMPRVMTHEEFYGEK
jgi:hypothetical protein